jgi:two-component system chemotaxis response regulator CheY
LPTFKSQVDFSKLRILIIENRTLMRRLLMEMLRGFGVQHIYQANGVPRAIEYVHGTKLDAIVLDFFLDELDGADFAKHIRHDEYCCNRAVPIQLVTGMPDNHTVIKVIDACVNGMLAKPIAPKDLYHRLETMIANPKPFVITNDYVGPTNSRKAPPMAMQLMRHKPIMTTARRSKAGRARAKIYVDGILL